VEWTPEQFKSLVLDIAVCAMLVPSIYFDLKENRIPNLIPYAFILIGLVLVLTMGDAAQVQGHLFGMVLGFAAFYLLYLAGVVGGADVKLICAIGLLKGLVFLWSVLFYTALIGGVVALVYLAAAFFKRKTLKEVRVSYATPICLGTFTVMGIQYGLIYRMYNVI
jgi:prepilin peptidase CpaA